MEPQLVVVVIECRVELVRPMDPAAIDDHHDLLTPTGDLITVEAPRLDWDGLSTLTATDLASPPLTNDEEVSALDQAREFLHELLTDGPLLAEEVSAAAKQAGMALATIRRAKPLAGVKTRRRRREDVPSRAWPWEWYLADEQSTCASPSIHSDEHLEHLENLPTKSITSEDSSRCSSEHLETEPQHKENQALALDAHPQQATPLSRVTAAHCPHGGEHNWLLRRPLGDQLCARCNATRPLVEASP